MPGGQNINISRIGDKDLRNIALNIDNNPNNGGKIKGSIDGKEISLFWNQAEPVIANKMKTPGFNLGYLQKFYDSHLIKSNSFNLDIAPPTESFDIKPGREENEGEVLVAKEVIAHDAPTRAEREAMRMAEIKKAAQTRNIETVAISGGKRLQMNQTTPAVVNVDKNQHGWTAKPPKSESEPCIMGKISLPDAQGNIKTITLKISEKSIASKGGALNEIISQIKKSINSLDPEVKNDLFNEINEINVSTHGAKSGVNGEYLDNGNVVFLTYGVLPDGKANESYQEKEKLGINPSFDDIHTSGINKKVLTHEIAHAVDMHHVGFDKDEFSSDELKDKFSQFKTAFFKSDKIRNDYKLNDEQNTSFVGRTYFLDDINEFYAEWSTMNHGNKDNKDYEILSKFDAEAKANPNDPVNKAYLEITSSFENIEKSRRESSLAESQGFSHIIKTHISKDENATIQKFIKSADNLGFMNLSPDTVGTNAFETYFEYAKSENKDDAKFKEHRLADSLLTKSDEDIKVEYGDGQKAERYIELRDSWRNFKELANSKFKELGWN